MNRLRIVMWGRLGQKPRAALLGWLVCTTACGWLALSVSATAQDPPPAPAPVETGNEQVLTRGPVHEAFAAPVVHDPKAGPVIAKEPPATVEEMPPDLKPAGPNVQWIPGYWSWDQERSDFLWISGVWREPPPGRQWVPGYWHQVEGGFQWVPGDWVPVSQPAAGAPTQPQASTQASYLPPPPQSLETGPNGPAPGPNVFWSPGNWHWQGERYVWRPGFWAASQSSWVWVAPHSVYTPGGYLFVEGYWDLPLANRGMLFAPVYYPQPVYLQPAYVFTPSITIATPGLVANLFVQPAYGCYCFGDYYSPSYLAVGIYPWFSFSYMSGPARPVFYDPVFTFYASINVARNPGWVTQVQREYIVRRDNVAMRPPRTLVEQTRTIERGGGGRAVVMTRSIQEIARNPQAAGGMRLERLSAASQRRWQERSVQLAQFRQERTRLERQAGSERRGGSAPGHGTSLAAYSRTLSLPASPVAAPIHHHAASGSPIGPSGHTDRQAALRGEPAERAGPRHEQGGARGFDQVVRGEAGAPLVHHDFRSGEQPLRGGQAAPHDVGRTPLLRSETPNVDHGRTGGTQSPQLHLPPQYTHRQPPPAPRARSLNEYREGTRNP